MTDSHAIGRRLGATKSADGWSFLVWAPHHDSLSVRCTVAGEDVVRPLSRGDCGYFSGDLPAASMELDYRYVLPDGQELADPASRWQPDGVHGRSRAFDPSSFDWTAVDFSPAPLAESVMYELHVGTFTAEGTFDAAVDHLDEIVDLGVTAVQPMPVAAFPGARNWGYDAVFPFAVQDSYGGPRGFQRFIDACHQRGLSVFLDVVYNHLGPEGCVLASFGPYFTDVYATPWGAAVNVAEAGSDEVRRYFTENAMQWLRDFRVDGLRLDAIHGIVDPTASPFLRELTAAVAALSAESGRRLQLVAESADNNPLVVSPASHGGLGFDGQWDDDFHHAVHALVTGERDGYYQDFGGVDLLARVLNDGFAYQGEYSRFRRRRHGASAAAIPKDHFVSYLQNHDQVGNRAGAERLVSIVEPQVARLAAATLLLAPLVAMLFMGEEYGETAPFPYFIDHGDADLVEAVRQGRAAEFGRGADSFDPADPETFVRARLDRSQRDSAAGQRWWALYRGLIEVRRQYPVLRDPDILGSTAAASDGVLTLRRRSSATMAFVALNFAGESRVVPLDRPGSDWRLIADAGDPRLGGEGTRCPELLEGGDGNDDLTITLPANGFCLYVATPTMKEST